MDSLNTTTFTGYIAVYLLIIVVFIDIPGSELVEQLLNNPEDEKRFLHDKMLILGFWFIFVLFKSYQLAVKNSRIITGFYQNGYLFARLRLSAREQVNQFIIKNLANNIIICISVVYICSALILKGFDNLCLFLAQLIYIFVSTKS